MHNSTYMWYSFNNARFSPCLLNTVYIQHYHNHRWLIRFSEFAGSPYEVTCVELIVILTALLFNKNTVFSKLYICTHTHTHIYQFLNNYTYIYIYNYFKIDICVCVCVCMYIYTQAHTYVTFEIFLYILLIIYTYYYNKKLYISINVVEERLYIWEIMPTNCSSTPFWNISSVFPPCD